MKGLNAMFKIPLYYIIQVSAKKPSPLTSSHFRWYGTAAQNNMFIRFFTEHAILAGYITEPSLSAEFNITKNAELLKLDGIIHLQ